MTLKGSVALAMSVAVHGVALIAIGSAMHGPKAGPALPRRESVPVRVRLIPAQAMHAGQAAPPTGRCARWRRTRTIPRAAPCAGSSRIPKGRVRLRRHRSSMP